MATGPFPSALSMGSRLHILFLGTEWSSSQGDFSTLNRELAKHFADCPKVRRVSFLVPPRKAGETKGEALNYNVHLVEATDCPGMDIVQSLSFPPDSLGNIDVVIGCGLQLGPQAKRIKEMKKCTWVQFVHESSEELGMFKGIQEYEEKHKHEIELCRMADLVIAVGPKLADTITASLRPDRTVTSKLIPGLFEEFAKLTPAEKGTRVHRIFVFGDTDLRDFELKGFDVAAKAVGSMRQKKYDLIFVGAPEGKQDEVKNMLLQEGITTHQLTVRSFCEDQEHLSRMFLEADLCIMPSRTEGFGLTALKAMSTGTPILVSHNSGFGQALHEVDFGSSCIVDSDDPEVWRRKMEDVLEKERSQRLEEAAKIRDAYSAKYSWKEGCDNVVEKICRIKLQDVNGNALHVQAHPPHSGPLQHFGPYTESAQQFSSQATRQGEKACKSKSQTAGHSENLMRATGTSLMSRLLRPLKSRREKKKQKKIRESCTETSDTILTSRAYKGKRKTKNEKETEASPAQVWTAGTPQLHSGAAQLSSRAHPVQEAASLGASGLPLPSASFQYSVDLPGNCGPRPAQPSRQQGQHFQQSTEPLDQPAQQQYGYHQRHSYYRQRYDPYLWQLQYGGQQQPYDYQQAAAEQSLTGHSGRTVYLPRDTNTSPGDSSAAPSNTTPPAPVRVYDARLSSDFRGIQEEIKRQYRKDKYITPFPWLDNFKLTLEDCFTRLKIVGKKLHQGWFVRSDKTIDMFQIFEPDEKNRPRTVLIEADPGMGKSTLCQKLCFDWSTDSTSKPFPQFEVVLWTKCRDMENVEILEVIADQNLPESVLKKKSVLFEFINKNPSKVLLIVDGVDELRRDLSLFDLFRGKILSRSTYFLVTTRHEAGIGMRQYFDSVLEIAGYTVPKAKEYITKYFKLMGKEDKAQYLLSKIDEEVHYRGMLKAENRNSIVELIKNPLTTSLLCMVCEEYAADDELPSRRTRLYEEITSGILKRHFVKENKEVPEEPLQHCKEDLTTLGKMALRGLEKDQLHFDAKELEGQTNITRLGFLSKEAIASKRKPGFNYSYTHKTFQEFFAAFYLSDRFVSGEVTVENFISQHLANIEKFEQVLIFSAGILAGKGAAAVNFVQSLARALTTFFVDYDDKIPFSFLLLCDVVSECGVGGQLTADQERLCAVIGQEILWEDLALSSGVVGDETSDRYKVLCEIIKSNRTVSGINLIDNMLTDVSSLLLNSLQNNVLEWVHLNNNPISDLTAVKQLQRRSKKLHIYTDEEIIPIR